MKESEIAELLRKENEEFRKLTEEHRSLDGLLSEIDSKRIQKQKLLKKDRMAELVREYRKSAQ